MLVINLSIKPHNVTITASYTSLAVGSKIAFTVKVS